MTMGIAAAGFMVGDTQNGRVHLFAPAARRGVGAQALLTTPARPGPVVEPAVEARDPVPGRCACCGRGAA